MTPLYWSIGPTVNSAVRLAHQPSQFLAGEKTSRSRRKVGWQQILSAPATICSQTFRWVSKASATTTRPFRGTWPNTSLTAANSSPLQALPQRGYVGRRWTPGSLGRGPLARFSRPGTGGHPPLPRYLPGRKGRHVQVLEHPVHAGCLLLAEPQKLRRSTPLVPPPLSYAGAAQHGTGGQGDRPQRWRRPWLLRKSGTKSSGHHPSLPLKLVIILYYFEKMKRP